MQNGLQSNHGGLRDRQTTRRHNVRPAQRTYRLNRWSSPVKTTYAPTGLSVAGRLLQRVAGPLLFFVDPTRMTNGELTSTMLLASWGQYNEPLIRDRFDRVQLEGHEYFVPRLPAIDGYTPAKAIERGLWRPADVALLAPSPPSVDVDSYVRAGVREQGLPGQQPRVSEPAAHVLLSQIWSSFNRRVQQRYQGLQADVLRHVQAFGLSIAAYQGPVVSNPGAFTGTFPILSDYQQLVWENGAFVIRTDYASYNAHQAQYANELYQWSQQQAAHERYLEEVEAHQAHVNRVQALVKQNGTAWDFVISQQPLRKTDYNHRKTQWRRNDKKTSGAAALYSTGLRLINNTYGTADEWLGIAQAFMWNIEPVGVPSASYWDVIRLSAHETKAVPINFKTAARLFYDGRADLDWFGFILDVVAMQATDYALGRVGQKAKDLAHLTGRPVGLQSGVAL